MGSENDSMITAYKYHLTFIRLFQIILFTSTKQLILKLLDFPRLSVQANSKSNRQVSASCFSLQTAGWGEVMEMSHTHQFTSGWPLRVRHKGSTFQQQPLRVLKEDGHFVHVPLSIRFTLDWLNQTEQLCLYVAQVKNLAKISQKADKRGEWS